MIFPGENSKLAVLSLHVLSLLAACSGLSDFHWEVSEYLRMPISFLMLSQHPSGFGPVAVILTEASLSALDLI